MELDLFWRKFLKNKRKRQGEAWPKYESSGTYFTSDVDALKTLRVALSLLAQIAEHGGTRVDRAVIKTQLLQLTSALPPSLIAQLDAESNDILDWLFEPTTQEEPTFDPESLAALRQSMPERLTLFSFAHQKNMDVTLEYYDPDTVQWTVVTGRPISTENQSFEIQSGTIQFTVDAKYVRWLTPVRAQKVNAIKPKKATVLSFPVASD